MITAIRVEANASHRGATIGPILARSVVNITSGTTAKES